MNYFMRITFPSTDDNTISSVRSEFAHRLRKMNLRYKSDIYYPESSWSTPAFGVPEELTFLIGAPKDKQVNYLEIEKTLHKLADEMKVLFPHIGKIHTEFQPLLLPR